MTTYSILDVEIQEIEGAKTLFGEIKALHEKDYKNLGSENFKLVADNYFEIISPFVVITSKPRIFCLIEPYLI